MKVCIYGAGAIGGYLGLLLFEAGYDVSLIDQGSHLRAIREHGLTLRINGESRTAHIPCTDKPETLAPQDYVIIAVKTYTVPEIVMAIPSLLHSKTAVVSVNNGIPWWYFDGTQANSERTSLESVDPGGKVWNLVGAERALGCVVYPACEVVSPGIIQHISGNRFALGEPSGEKSERVMRLAQAMRNSGLKAPVKTQIRDEVWMKLWGNLAFNPISVLTGATLQQICEQQDTRALAREMMLEAKGVAENLGIRFALDVEQRIAGAEAVGEHKTSMLQDFEAGRPLEMNALLTAVQELGVLVGHKTSTIDQVVALLKLKVKSLNRVKPE
jgi:2-dehydropantoate 2-reductase